MPDANRALPSPLLAGRVLKSARAISPQIASDSAES